MKYFWFHCPTQLLIQGQWWSILKMHLPQMRQWCARGGRYISHLESTTSLVLLLPSLRTNVKIQVLPCADRPIFVGRFERCLAAAHLALDFCAWKWKEFTYICISISDEQTVWPTRGRMQVWKIYPVLRQWDDSGIREHRPRVRHEEKKYDDIEDHDIEGSPQGVVQPGVQNEPPRQFRDQLTEPLFGIVCLVLPHNDVVRIQYSAVGHQKTRKSAGIFSEHCHV